MPLKQQKRQNGTPCLQKENPKKDARCSKKRGCMEKAEEQGAVRVVWRSGQSIGSEIVQVQLGWTYNTKAGKRITMKLNERKRR